MGIGSFMDFEPKRSGLRAGGPLRESRLAIGLLTVVFLGFPESLDAQQYPSKMILGLRSTCMETCKEKESPASCTRYCDCHLFELRRDLSDAQVEQMLLTAERGGQGAEAIRDWLKTSARRCEKRVFGDKGEKDATGDAKKAR